MGLDDLLPDGVNKSSGSSSNQSSSTPEKKYKVIGSDPYRKKFTLEKWEEVKDVIRHEMGLNVNEVLNNVSAEKRFDILHEAATFSNGELDRDDMENWSTARCIVCGKAADEVGVEIAGETVCFHHTIAQLEQSLQEDN